MEKALQFLRNHNELALATIEDNKPKIRIFQIMKQEGTTLFFCTNPKKDVWKQLQHNPNLELLASYGQEYVRCVGKAHFDVDDERQRWIFENNPVLQRLYDDYHGMAFFRMDIEQMDHYDLRPTPPYFKHYDLIEGTVGDGFVGDKWSKNK